MLSKTTLLISCWLFAVSESGINLLVVPPVIEIGFTNSFSIECAIAEGTNSGGVHVASIILSRTNQTHIDEFTELAYISAFGGDAQEITPENATIEGLINGTYRSYLRLTWANPSYDRAGLYRCEATGIDGIGHHYGYVSVSNISVEEPDIEGFEIAMQSFIETTTLLDAMSDSGKSLWLQVESSKLEYFVASSSFNGSSYHLSFARSVLVSTRCQATCQIYGGYLAEINSAQEMAFVRDFIKSIKNDTLRPILIGGTDEGHEKTWVSTDSNRTLEYFDFMPGQPAGTTNQNCLYLNATEWKMDDLPCMVYKVDTLRFLCEIPDS